MESFKTLEELQEYNKQPLGLLNLKRLKDEPNAKYEQDYFKRITQNSQPEKVFSSDWSSYHTIDLADTLLPKTYAYKSNGTFVFDCAELFIEVPKTMNKELSLSNDEKLLTTIFYTYPKGVKMAEKKNTLLAQHFEIAVFAEVDKDNTIDMHLKFGDDFKQFLNYYYKKKVLNKTVSSLENKIYKTTVNNFKANFAEGMMHFHQMKFVLDLLEINVDEVEVKDYVIKGYWSKDKEGKIRITNANLGEMVYFHLITQGIKDETKIVLQLQDNDDGILINPPDRKFLQKNREKKLSEDVVNKTVYISKDRAVTSLYLSDLWADMIEDDNGAEIELEWMAFSNSFEKKVKSEVLNVGFSKKHLFLKPAYENYSLPELLTKDGETIIFSISDFAREEVINQLVAPAGELAKKYRYNLATRVLKSGKKATNIGEVYQRKKAIYTYNVFTNEGKEVTLKQASNFGFKNKYINNGKLVTTKGISQIDYFANIGLKNNVLKAATEITQIWDIFDLAKVLFQDDLSEIPVGYLGNPVSFGYALLNEAVIKPTIQGIKDDWNKGLEEDFETIYKPKGLEACKAFADNRRINSPIKYLDIYTPTLQKLLKNEFLSLDDMDEFNKKIQEKEIIKSNNRNIFHTVFYKSEKNKYGLNDDVFINCTFIND